MISLLHSSTQNYPDWPIGELQLQLKTRCHICYWLAPTGSFVGDDMLETCFERHPSPWLWIQYLFVLLAVNNALFWTPVTVDMSMIFSLHIASKNTVKYVVLPDHCWELLQSLVGLLDFISWPTSGTLNIYSAPGRESVADSWPDWGGYRHREYRQVTVGQKKTRCSADDCTLVFGQIQTEKEQRIHEDFFQKYSIGYFSSHHPHLLFAHSVNFCNECRVRHSFT